VLEKKCGNNVPTYDQLKQMEYLERCIKETLRISPPAPIVLRQVREDQQIQNIYVTKGCMVGVHIYGIHHDPEYWENPECYDPERFTAENSKKRPPNAWMPFSVGPRQCIGNNFALLEMRCFLARILQSFEILKDPNSKEPFGEYLGTGIHPPPNCTLLFKEM
jgi:cytochrome P450 family 4